MDAVESAKADVVRARRSELLQEAYTRLAGRSHEEVGKCYGFVAAMMASVGVVMPKTPADALACKLRGLLPTQLLPAGNAVEPGVILEFDVDGVRHLAVVVVGGHPGFAAWSTQDAGVHLVRMEDLPLRYLAAMHLPTAWVSPKGDA
jgi:hypothetical protein